MDLTALCGAVLHSIWLLPVLALMIAVDGPLPMLPSESLLLSALALALADRDVAMLCGLVVVSLAGSVTGDLALFALGRTSRRFVAQAEAEGRLTAWVRTNVLCRPRLTMIGARFVPAGRLVSGAAAGRFGLPVGTFGPCSMVSSSVWVLYMCLVAAVISPVADGRPVPALLGGIAAGAAMTALCAVVTACQDRWGGLLPQPTRPS